MHAVITYEHKNYVELNLEEIFLNVLCKEKPYSVWKYSNYYRNMSAYFLSLKFHLFFLIVTKNISRFSLLFSC